MTITATQLKENLGYYLESLAYHGDELRITKNGKLVALMSSPKSAELQALETLSNLLPDDMPYLSADEYREMSMRERYGQYFD